jgi:dUTP pyrophosphatase
MSEELNNINEEEINMLMKLLDDIDIDESQDIDYNVIMDSFGIDIDELEREMEEYIPKIEMGFVKSKEDTVSPSYNYVSDSGFDLYTIEECWIQAFDRQLINTGLILDIPEGYEIQVRSKSGLALKQGLMVLNSPGTVDQGYLGEIQVILFNTTNQRVKIEKGQKIAQAVLCPVVSGKWVEFVEKNKLEGKDRNDNGFGSTGLK